MSEDDCKAGSEDNAFYASLSEFAQKEHEQVMPVCAKLEEEISSLDRQEKSRFRADIGLEQSGLDRMVGVCYRRRGLISFLAAGEPVVRAGTSAQGARAPQAAGKIHSDFERGFIRAEVVPFDVLMECGSLSAAKEKGLVRSEGKDYVMQDGDVVLFRFNV